MSEPPLKLHLGCGERYLQGYLNVDYPPSEHPVQSTNVADLYANIATLKYPAGSIEEVRLHHVFEHFTRPVACALVAAWNSWLQPNGLIHIEVPDLHRTARAITSPLTSLRSKAVAERHLFGSHEAHWAVHYEGYTPALLKKLVGTFGFVVQKIEKNSRRGTYNFALLARKVNGTLGKAECTSLTEEYLSSFLVDTSETEKRLLAAWMEIYTRQIERSWADG